MSMFIKQKFDENPQVYAPVYGGWCAWAMANGSPKVSVDYDTFIIAKNEDGEDRLYLFYNNWGNNTLKKWQKGKHEELVSKADDLWGKQLEKAEVEKAKEEQ